MKSRITIGKTPLLFLVCALFMLAGCGDSAERERERRALAITDGLDTANNLMHAGAIQRAVQQLEMLDAQYPNQPEILEALAFAYAEQPDPALAAFYFEILHDLQPDRTDFPLYAASAHVADGDLEAAARNYSAYLILEPGDASAHRALADIHQRLNRHREALDSLLNALRAADDSPDARDAARVGSLYGMLGNKAQAEHWYRQSLQLPARADGHRHARLGLLRISVQGGDWDAAQSWLSQLDQHHPGALEGSELADIRRQLAEYQAAREAAERQREAARQRREQARLEAEQADAAAATTTAEPEAEPTVEPEADTTPSVAVATTTDKVQAPERLYPEPATATIEAPAPEPTPTAPQGLLEEGKAAYADGDYDRAVRLFQSALTENPTSAEIAYNLSRAYFQQNRFSEAELLGAEAVRMDPENLVYTMNYLRAMQRSQSTERFIRELQQAQQRFPRSPDLTLALGRANHHLLGNTRNAAFLYRQFLDMAPNHPRAGEISNTLRDMGEP